MAEILRYRKLPGGMHYHNDGQCYKEGDILEIEKGSLSDSLLSTYELIGPKKTKAAKPEIVVDEGSTLELKVRGPGWYDVINKETGKPVNDQALRRPEAEALVNGSQQE